MWHKLLLNLSKLYLRQRLRRRPPQPLASLDLDKIERVLLISATALGDTLFSTPAIRALKERFPHLHLEVLAHRRSSALLAYNPHIERVWSYPGRNRELLALARRLRRQRFDLAVILHGNDPEATLLAYLTNSPYIIGSARSPLALVYSGAVGEPSPLEHAIERRLAYVRLLGADTPNKRMDLALPREELRRAEALLVRHFGELPSRLMALHPTGSDPYKWWPAQSFAELGDFLFQEYQAPLLILSGRGDRKEAERLAAQMSGPTLVTGGRFSLLTTAAMLSKCRLLVANDSGPLHMGLALGVPTIALLGADHPCRVGPYQVPWGTFLHKLEQVCSLEPCLLKKCPDNRCLKAITVSEVIELVKTWWEPQFLVVPGQSG
jgi:ADP-heptose:LPS heptosyltransferase